MKKDIIHNMDCLVGMRELPDHCIDAVIADLPYGVLNRGNKAAAWDRIIPLDLLWEQYNRIAKPGCPIILFSQGMFTGQPDNVSAEEMEIQSRMGERPCQRTPQCKTYAAEEA